MIPQEELKHVAKSFEHVAKSFEGEPMEVCKHCGTKWYSVHFKNGCCYDCQQKGLHKEKIVFTKPWEKGLFIIAFALGMIEVVFSLVTVGLYGKLMKPTLSVRVLTWLANKRR